MKIGRTSNGILLKNSKLSLLIDPDGSSTPLNPDLILVSHAHTDHSSGLSQFTENDIPVVLSQETYQILKAKGTRIPHPRLIAPGEEIELKDGKIKALRSGHMLGSLQFVIDFFEQQVAYTGDLNYERSLVLPRAQVPKADILLLDCTYGNPYYLFPKRKNLYPKIREKIQELMSKDSKLFLHGYTLGKAQELTKMVWDFFGKRPGVSDTIRDYNSILEKNADLGEYEVNDGQQFQIRRMGGRNEEKKAIHINFTGWAVQRTYSNKIGFPLSSHSDFLELLEFVGEVEPEKVLTLYSFKEHFAEIVRRELGIRSFSLQNELKQVGTSGGSLTDYL